MKILLTGGSGFIGQHFIKHLLSNDSVEIVNLDLKESAIISEKMKTIIVNICDDDALNQLDLKANDFDWCIHLAALCKEPGFEWEEYFETNYRGTEYTISLCERLNIKKILFTSTMMVFKAGEKRFTEYDLTCPDTAYGISKLLAEKSIQAWQGRNKEREFKVIRPAVVFGYNENANFTRLLNTLKKGFFVYVGRRSTVKSNIYVLELVNFIMFLMNNETRNNFFNFAFPNESDMKTIIQAFKKSFGLKVFAPVLPYKLLRLAAFFFEALNSVGLKNSIHHRRIEKLYFSSNIEPKSAIDEGYEFQYDLESALLDWREMLNADSH